MKPADFKLRDVTAEHRSETCTRAEASLYLHENWGISCAVTTLAAFAWKGGGPPFLKVGKHRVLYTKGALDDWAESRLSQPITTTSELYPL